MESQLNFGIGAMNRQSSSSDMVVKVLLCRLTRSPTRLMGLVREFIWIRTVYFLNIIFNFFYISAISLTLSINFISKKQSRANVLSFHP